MQGQQVASSAGVVEDLVLLGGQLDLKALVGRDAPFIRLLGILESVDVLTGGALVRGDGELQDAAAAFQLQDVLDRPLAVAPLADHLGPVVVLKTGRENFRRGGRRLVDEDHHREVGELPVLLGGVFLGRRVPALGTDDHALVHEEVGNFDRRGEKPAGVVAEIDDQRLHPFGFQLGERFFQLVGRRLDEAGDPHVADLAIVVEHEIPLIVGLARIAQHARRIDLGAGHLECFKLVDPLVLHGELDIGARPTGEDLDGLVRSEPLGALPIDIQDEVARHDPGVISRGADHRRDHAEPLAVGVELDLNADPGVSAFDRLLERPPLVLGDELRVRVEVLEHPPEGALQQFAAVDRPDVGGFDLLDGVHEGAVKLHHLILRLRPLRGLPAEQRDGGDGGEHRQVPARHGSLTSCERWIASSSGAWAALESVPPLLS